MSRINYCDDEDFAGQFELWRSNLHRSLHGKKGVATLRELEAILAAMPEKRLIEQDIANDHGEVCAVGALLASRLRAKGMGHEMACHVLRLKQRDIRRTEDLAAEYGVPKLVAWRLVELNDMDLAGATPEQRYQRVLTWVRGCLDGSAQNQ